MADRLNDTDPQSPNALVHRTDPGLGGGMPVPAVPTPSPGSASIEELIDGITGPRPAAPPSRRDAAAADSARAYAPARHAPASQPMPPPEPLVVSPDPPLYSGAGRTPRDLEVPPMVQPESGRPPERPAQERTVFTGRRALVRKLAVVMASSAAVAIIMMTTMRWKEGQRPRRPSEVVVLPAAPDEPQDPTARAGAAQTAMAPVAPPAVVPAAAITAPLATAAVAMPVSKPAASAQKRVRPEAKPAPQQDALDDLNRQIRH